MANDEFPPLGPIQLPFGQGDVTPYLPSVESVEPGETGLVDQLAPADDDTGYKEDNPHGDSPRVMEADMTSSEKPQLRGAIARHPSSPEPEPERPEPTIREEIGYNGNPSISATLSNSISKNGRRLTRSERRPITDVLARRPPGVRAAPEVVRRIIAQTKANLAAIDSPTERLEAQYRAAQAARGLVDNNPRKVAPSQTRGRPYSPHPGETSKEEDSEE